MPIDLSELDSRVAEAVRFFWRTRGRQIHKRQASGTADQGARGAVTGGRQMDGFVKLLCQLIVTAGLPDACVFRNRAIELPGYFRPTKQWDLLVVDDSQLLAVLELKSQIGPSFGNNFNNRAEEAIGSAVDLWTAYREGAFGESQRPWLGYIFLLEDCAKSRAPVVVDEPHFAVFPEFRNASYMTRYGLLCRKLVRERLYDAAAFLVSPVNGGMKGVHSEPSPDLGFGSLAASIAAKMAAHAANRTQ